MQFQDDPSQDYDLIRAQSLKQANANAPDPATVSVLPVAEYVAATKTQPRYLFGWMFLLSLTVAACLFVGYIAPV